jgi:hypothetical protein
VGFDNSSKPRKIGVVVENAIVWRLRIVEGVKRVDAINLAANSLAVSAARAGQRNASEATCRLSEFMTEYPTPNPELGIDLGQKPQASAAPRRLFYFIMT